MVKTDRLSITGALIVCLVGVQWSEPLFASEQSSTPRAESSAPLAAGVSADAEAAPAASSIATTIEEQAARTDALSEVRLVPRFAVSDDFFTAHASGGAISESLGRRAVTFRPLDSSSFAQRRGFGGRGRGRNGAAQAEIILGAAASIAGAALLVYANRPECSTNPTPGGCGYGTKVIGGAVLSAGIVSLLVGAATWR